MCETDDFQQYHIVLVLVDHNLCVLQALLQMS